jgi:hypothetical protein
MANPKMSDALLQETINAMAKYKGVSEAARALHIPRPTLQCRAAEARQRGLKPNNGIPDGNNPQVMRSQIRRLEAELKAHQKVAEQSTIIKGVIGAMSRQVEELDAPTWTVTPRGTTSAPGVPTLFISDLHWGEIVYPAQINHVNEYNIKIAHERMATLIDSAIHLLEIVSPAMDYPGIVVPLGGDLISGNIHDELTATNELNSMPTVLDIYGVLVGVITTLADRFKRVFLPCVSGNHGRDTQKIWVKDRHATSFDWLICRFLAKHFEQDKRITFFIPDGPDAYYKIYDHAYLLTHGDQFRGGDGLIGCLGPIIRGDHKKRSRNAQVDMDYDTMIIGHWHQYIHHSRVIVNGALKGYDEYAYSNNFGFESPCQALWLTHPKYHITYRMPVYVDRKRPVIKTNWVSVPK